ncbi:MAG TPA: hypothetical protein VH913_16020, partial [Hyphomicrobiaceae bacterium]
MGVLASWDRRGQGLGTEATRLVLAFAFHVPQLRNMLLETLEWNALGWRPTNALAFAASACAAGRGSSHLRVDTPVLPLHALGQDTSGSGWLSDWAEQGLARLAGAAVPGEFGVRRWGAGEL